MFDKTEGCVLAVDIGSSSVKGALFSTSCRLIPDTFFALEHKQTNSFDGGVEENPLYIQKISDLWYIKPLGYLFDISIGRN